MWFLLACAPPPEPVTAPEVHSWKEEGQLVIDGLEQVKQLYRDDQRDAARVLAERVYSERYEPRLEPALVRIKGERERLQLEYAFGQLVVMIDTRNKHTLEHLGTLESKVTQVALDAQHAFPTPGETVVPATTEENSLKPLVPDVRPNWERGIEAKPVMGAKTEKDAK